MSFLKSSQENIVLWLFVYERNSTMLLKPGNCCNFNNFSCTRALNDGKHYAKKDISHKIEVKKKQFKIRFL